MDLRAMIFGKDTRPSAEVHEAVAGERLRAVQWRLSSLRETVETESARADSLRVEVQELEQRRREALLNRRLGLDGPDEVQGIEQRLAEVGRELADAEGLMQAARQMSDSLAPSLDAVRRDVCKVLGAELDQAFAEAARDYMDAARCIAEMAVRLAAIQELMIAKGVGNSNGFEPRIYLPAAKPGEGRTIAPVIDSGSRDFVARVQAGRSALTEGFTARGLDI